MLSGDSDYPTVKILAISAHELLVELFQTEFNKGENNNWLTSDHLEIWQRLHKGTSDNPGDTVYRWGIRLVDGKVFHTQNNSPNPPEVSITNDKPRKEKFGSVIIKIKLNDKMEAASSISISYSRAGNDKRAASIVSTSSHLLFNNQFTLSPVFKIDSALATPVIVNNTLSLKYAYKIERDKPIINLIENTKGILPSKGKLYDK